MASDDEKKRKKKKKQNEKTKEPKNNENGKEEKKPVKINDERFASAQSDPRFMEAPRKRTKVEIDSRFSRIFSDKSFTSSNAAIDKRGRPINAKSRAASLARYYRMGKENKEDRVKEEDSDESSSESDELKEEEDDFDDQTLDDDADETSSASDTASSDDEEEVVEEEDDDTFLPPEENVPDIDKETPRLAVVNLDWGQVRAVDLYVMLSSFLPKGGQIMSVSVYPSEFGLKRMEEEAVRGPVGLFEEDEEGDGDEDDEETVNKKIRSYELSRLRYYFAVVECDSIATADYIYNACDGIEFERSANKLDLRFIPDDMEFKHEPRDVATEVPAGYEGLDFQTRALQQSNVQLTWDEDEPQRIKTLKRKLNDEQLADLELKEFLASEDSETDDEDSADEQEDRSLKKHKKKDKYRALLKAGSGEDDEDDGNQDMEVTFNSGLEDISKRILEKKDKKSETVWEATLRKGNEKRKARKRGSESSSEDDDSSDDDQEIPEQSDDFFDDEPSAMESKRKNLSVSNKTKNFNRDSTKEAEATGAELELLLADDNEVDANIKGYNLKPKKNKNKKRKTIPDETNLLDVVYGDPRFSALLTSPLFALDPTDPNFKRSGACARQHKMRTRENIKATDPSVESDQPSLREVELMTNKEKPERKENYELSSMVRSLKMKSKQVQGKASQKNKNLQYKAKMKK